MLEYEVLIASLLPYVYEGCHAPNLQPNVPINNRAY